MKNIFSNVMVLAGRARFAARVMVLASLLASPLLAAPTPTAVWTTGQFGDAASDHGGYAITLNSGNSTNETGNIAIGSSATTPRNRRFGETTTKSSPRLSMQTAF